MRLPGRRESLAAPEPTAGGTPAREQADRPGVTAGSTQHLVYGQCRC
jgi:hypothetical protein